MLPNKTTACLSRLWSIKKIMPFLYVCHDHYFSWSAFYTLAHCSHTPTSPKNYPSKREAKEGDIPVVDDYSNFQVIGKNMPLKM